MNERAVFDPWNNAQDKLIADYNTVSGQAGATVVHSSAICTEGVEVLLSEMLQEESRLQGPGILVSGTGILNAHKSKGTGPSASAVIAQLLQAGTAGNGKISVLNAGDGSPETEDQELRRYVFANHRTQKQIVIARDEAFLAELRQLCKADTASAQGLPELVTLSLNDKGELANPFDKLYSCEAERIAVERLADTARRSLICMDAAGLKHAQARDFLRHVKAPLVAAKSQLVVFAYKDQPLPLADLLLARAQENPPTVRFAYLNRDLPVSDAIVEALLKEAPTLAGRSVAYITDKVATGSRVANQLGKSALRLSVFSINRHGFLSNIDRAITAQAKGSTPAAPRLHRGLADAIAADDEEKVASLVSRSSRGGEIIEQGIIAALRLGKDKYVEQLVRLADTCSPAVLNWWVLDYPGFKDPAYLSANALHFCLLKELIAKTKHERGFQHALGHLKELNEVPAASHDKFHELIALMETDDAPKGMRYETGVRKKLAKMQDDSAPSLARAAFNALAWRADVPKRYDWCVFNIAMVLLKRLYDCCRHNSQASRHAYTGTVAFSELVDNGTFNTEKFKEFCGGFDADIQEILQGLEIPWIVRQIQEFKETSYIRSVIGTLLEPAGDFSPGRFSDDDFSELVDILIQSMAESAREPASFYTTNDLSALLCDLLVSGRQKGNTQPVSIYDMAVGSANTLYSLEKKLVSEYNCRVDAYGPDCNKRTAAFAKIRAIARGCKPGNIVHADTTAGGAFPMHRFDYVVCDPPYGMNILREMCPIEGYPVSKDRALYSMMLGLSKLKDDGKLAILHPGRTLFAMGKDCNEVRRYLIENDLLDAVIQLPGSLALHTSIPLYVWILSKSKPEERRGKVLLIDASACGGEMQTSGPVHCRAFPESARKLILQAYGAFENDTVYGDPQRIHCETRLVENHLLGYRKITVEHPTLTKTGKVQMKKDRPVPDRTLREEFIVPWNESPDVFLAREVLPLDSNAWINHECTSEHFEIKMLSLFYKVPDGDTFEGSLTRNITVLRDRIDKLKEEYESKFRRYKERLATMEEKLDVLEGIAAETPGMRHVARRSTVGPRIR